VALVATDKALSYTLYLLSASIVETMAVAERLDFLRTQGLFGLDVREVRDAVNSGLERFVVVREGIQRVVTQLKGLPFVSADLRHFTLEDDTPEWNFRQGLGMEGLTPAAIEEVRAQKVNAYAIVRQAELQSRVRLLCTNCGKGIAVKICERCEQFATCVKCNDHVCSPK
jgi:hypothetical protein